MARKCLFILCNQKWFIKPNTIEAQYCKGVNWFVMISLTKWYILRNDKIMHKNVWLECKVFNFNYFSDLFWHWSRANYSCRNVSIHYLLNKWQIYDRCWTKEQSGKYSDKDWLGNTVVSMLNLAIAWDMI